jgi:predicted neuraminidase
LPAGLNGPVKTKPIAYKGLIYCGSSVETIIDWTSYIEVYKIKKGKFEYVSRSQPLIVPKKLYKDPYYGNRLTMGIIQPALWEVDGVLGCFFRSSRGLGEIYNTSGYAGEDGNYIWLDPESTGLANPNSGVDVVHTNRRLFLVHNPSDTYRRPLVITEIGRDWGIHLDKLVIQDETQGVTNSPELSYPYMIENDGKLHLVYTYGRSKIEYVTIVI